MALKIGGGAGPFCSCKCVIELRLLYKPPGAYFYLWDSKASRILFSMTRADNHSSWRMGLPSTWELSHWIRENRTSYSGCGGGFQTSGLSRRALPLPTTVHHCLFTDTKCCFMIGVQRYQEITKDLLYRCSHTVGLTHDLLITSPTPNPLHHKVTDINTDSRRHKYNHSRPLELLYVHRQLRGWRGLFSKVASWMVHQPREKLTTLWNYKGLNTSMS